MPPPKSGLDDKTLTHSSRYTGPECIVWWAGEETDHGACDSKVGQTNIYRLPPHTSSRIDSTLVTLRCERQGEEETGTQIRERIRTLLLEANQQTLADTILC